MLSDLIFRFILARPSVSLSIIVILIRTLKIDSEKVGVWFVPSAERGGGVKGRILHVETPLIASSGSFPLD